MPSDNLTQAIALLDQIDADPTPTLYDRPEVNALVSALRLLVDEMTSGAAGTLSIVDNGDGTATISTG